MEKETWPRDASCGKRREQVGRGGAQSSEGHGSGLSPPFPRGYLDAPGHRSIVQQQLQDVEADDEHGDALGGVQRGGVRVVRRTGTAPSPPGSPGPLTVSARRPSMARG